MPTRRPQLFVSSVAAAAMARLNRHLWYRSIVRRYGLIDCNRATTLQMPVPFQAQEGLPASAQLLQIVGTMERLSDHNEERQETRLTREDRVKWGARRVGTVVADCYRIEELIGIGGFSEVYRARHVRIPNMHVAVKFLRRELSCDERALRRMTREAAALATMRSPNTVRVLDAGTAEDESAYIVMEWVEGVTLRDVLNVRRTLDETHCARFALQVLKALEIAHSRGIVHRDLKPSNLFISWEDRDHPEALVGDFGIAKLVEPEGELEEYATHTTTGALICTPMYVAPEMLDGVAEPASDLYALGHLMAEALDGAAPYAACHPLAVAGRHLDSEPVPLGPRSTASQLVSVIRRATAKRLSDRFATAREMSAEIVRCVGAPAQLDIVASPLPRPPRTPLMPRNAPFDPVLAEQSTEFVFPSEAEPATPGQAHVGNGDTATAEVSTHTLDVAKARTALKRFWALALVPGIIATVFVVMSSDRGGHDASAEAPKTKPPAVDISPLKSLAESAAVGCQVSAAGTAHLVSLLGAASTARELLHDADSVAKSAAAEHARLGPSRRSPSRSRERRHIEASEPESNHVPEPAIFVPEIITGTR